MQKIRKPFRKVEAILVLAKALISLSLGVLAREEAQ
jgi:hypothetical protein